jgi:hypothetical protein
MAKSAKKLWSWVGFSMIQSPDDSILQSSLTLSASFRTL